ncbi:MAG TPA: ABC transporter ATP-binding protein [Luteibaculaceae bacterium]|nr:ABC transporter ATP-binding protein [Luteibaculaceae bacterium]
MKKLPIVLGYLAPYRAFVALSTLFFLLASVFSLFSFTSIIPFLNILFKTTESDIPESAPALTWSSESLLNFLNYQVNAFVQQHGEKQALFYICIFIVSMFFFKNLLRYLAYYFLAPVRNGIMRDLRQRIENHLLKLPASYFTDERKGNIISKVTNDVTEVEWAIIGSIELVFRDPVTLLIYLGTMIFMSWQLTLFVICILPVSGLLIGGIAKTLRRPAQKGTQKMGEVISIIEETLGGIRIIKAFGAEKQVAEKFKETNDEHFRLMTKVFRRQFLGSPSSEFFGSLAMALLLWFGGGLIIEGNSGFTGSFFIAYVVIFSQMIQPAKAISDSLFRLKKGMVSVERINEILKAQPEDYQTSGGEVNLQLQGELSFENVSFSYPNGTQVLHHINLTIKKGQTLALVGQSGGGKTTLANLVPRFFDHQSGHIRIDGKDIKEIPLQALRSMIGIVTQESILFNDTVFNNIALGREHVPLEAVEAAAKVANAHDFIVDLPNGYYTNIGDLGSKLSGGQRQRLAIARAVLKNPDILILDEATSALDTESEKWVQDALEKLMKNRTSIVIAHRLTTIQHADIIAVIEKGQVVETGNHQELLAKQGAYSRFVEMQRFQ